MAIVSDLCPVVLERAHDFISMEWKSQAVIVCVNVMAFRCAAGNLPEKKVGYNERWASVSYAMDFF